MKNHRDDAAYEIGGLSKGIKVLEALEGEKFEPVDLQTVMDRTGFSRDLVMRALRTLAMHGYARRDGRKWIVGPRVLKFSERYNELCLRALAKR